MKKRMLAMFLGGLMAAGSLAMQMPETVWAITLEECELRSEPHINDFTLTAGDGQITVTVDLEYENQNSSGAEIFMLDKELNKDMLNDVDPESGMTYLWKELKEELEAEGKNGLIDDDSRKKWILLDGSCTFTGLTNGKTYYIYAEVADFHTDEDNLSESLHSAVYFGSVTVGSNASDTPGNESSDNNSSDIESSEDSAPVVVPHNYTKEAEEKMLSQIGEAPNASTIAIDKGITALPNSVMKELQKRGDVSLSLDFTYMGQRYMITIPAGAALDEDIPWYGPLYLAQHFGNGAETTGFEVYAEGTEAEMIRQIEEAPATATIIMEKGIMSLSNALMKELQKKGDVSLRLEFTYENKEYVITIPAGAALDEDIPWYGPMYLIQHFDSSVETAD